MSQGNGLPKSPPPRRRRSTRSSYGVPEDRASPAPEQPAQSALNALSAETAATTTKETTQVPDVVEIIADPVGAANLRTIANISPIEAAPVLATEKALYGVLAEGSAAAPAAEETSSRCTPAELEAAAAASSVM